MASNELEVKIGADIAALMKGLGKAKAQLDSFGDDVDSFGARLKRAGMKMESVGKSMSRYISLPLAALGGVALKTAGDFEKLETSLKTSFNGSEKAAKAAFKTITEFAAKTPFQVEQVADAFIKLKNLGLDPSERALTAYGNTASSMGKSLNQMIEAVADASTGEFERLKEFGIRASKQGDKVSFTFKGVTKTVAMESAAIEGYLMNIGETDFAGGMEAQSKTFLGRLSTLKDSVSLVMRDFGDIMLEFVNPVIDTISDLVKKFGQLSPQTKKIIVVMTALAAALPPLLVGLGFLSTTLIPALVAGFGVLLSPISLITAAIIALGVVVYKNFDAIIDNVALVYNSFVDLYNQSTLLRGIINGIGAAFQIVFIKAKTAIMNIWTVMKGVGQNITTLWSGIGDVITGALTGDLGKIKDGLSQTKDAFLNGFNDIYEGVKENNEAAGAEIANTLTNAIDNTLSGNLEKTTPEKLKNGLTNMASSVMEHAKNVGSQIASSLGLGFSGGGRQGGGGQLPEGASGIDNSGMGVVSNILPNQNNPLGLSGIVATESQKTVEELSNLNDQANEIINTGLANTFNNMVDAMAGALSRGGNVIKAGGDSMLSSLGRILVDLGKMTLGVGKAIAAVKSSLSSLNPAAAIGAGIALLAIGAAFSAGASKLAGNSGGGSSTGFSSSGSDFSGSTGGQSFSGSRQSFSGGGSNSLQNVVFEIQGTKLVGVLSNTLKRNKSLSGTLSVS